MKKIPSCVVSCALVTCGLAAGAASAVPLVWSSGDLGNNVIPGQSDYFLFPELLQPTGAPAFLTIEYGLWNSPDVFVEVGMNGTPVGSFLADLGFLNPGPEFVTFDVTGLLVDGTNTVQFITVGSLLGEYVVGSAEIRYDGVPAPGAAALLALGGLEAGRRRR
jgi:MYXO-CTERM domain-containing protein